MMDRTTTASMPMTLGDSNADADLVERYLAGDMTAFDELMIRYERQIYRVCYRFVENREDAMDLAQEVFIKAFEHLSGFRRESSLKTWLYRIAMNHCINHVKKQSHEFVEVTENIGSVRASVQSQLEDREQREHFRRLVKQLPPKQKAILEMRINEQLSYEEIAEELDAPLGTVKAQLHRARELMYDLVKNKKEHL